MLNGDVNLICGFDDKIKFWKILVSEDPHEEREQDNKRGFINSPSNGCKVIREFQFDVDKLWLHGMKNMNSGVVRGKNLHLA